jgi:hypothetical protein
MSILYNHPGQDFVFSRTLFKQHFIIPMEKPLFVMLAENG